MIVTPLNRLRLALCALLALTTLAAAARAPAAEQITHFDCRVVAQDGGFLEVTETITVVAEGNQIRHGIYRDIPTRYSGGWLNSGARVPFEILAIECDGVVSPYHTENRDTFERILIGDKAALVPPGEHTYTLRYRTRQLRFFKDHDEVYWNATGNGWLFPIKRATVRVELPASVAAEVIEAEAYLGKIGSKNQNGVQISINGTPPTVTFSAAREFPPGEGMTVVVTFPKHAIAEPPFIDRMREDPFLYFGTIAVFVVIAYFTVAWLLVGRDPSRGVIIPQFEPPDGLSPAASRFVARMGFDKECFSVALLSLGSQGALQIEQDGRDYTLRKTGNLPENASTGEKKVFSALLGSRMSLPVKQTYHATFSRAIADLRTALTDEYEGALFLPNRKWFFCGAALAIVSLVVVRLLAGGGNASAKAGFLTAWLSFWTVAVVALVHATISQWRAVFTTGNALQGVLGVGTALFATAFATPFLVAEGFGVFLLAESTSIWMIPILLAMITTVACFYELIKAPTMAGRATMDRIDGFRMYLATAEEDRLEAIAGNAFDSDRHAPAPRTLELFERFLPFAIALGVADQWAAKFHDLIEAASAAETSGGGYHPAWYQGNAWSSANIGAAAAGVGTAMAAAAAAAATSPSSSSGGGGGGSSGGGGGGGGGGGW
jgi:uncharacterized membrane protein YgcG